MNKKKLEKIIKILFKRYDIKLNEQLLKKLLDESEKLESLEAQKKIQKSQNSKAKAEKASGIADARKKIIRYVLGRIDFFVPKKPKTHAEKKPAPVVEVKSSKGQAR
jgi:hypothetical protein